MTLKDKQETNDNASSLGEDRPVVRRIGRPRTWPQVRLAPRLGWEAVDRNENRARIVAALEDVPGLSFRGLSRALGLASGTLRHHLPVLQSQDLIWRMDFGQSHRYFAGPCPEEVTPKILASSCLVDELDLRILAELTHERIQASVIEAVAGNGVARSKVQHRLYRLEDLGLVRVERTCHFVYYKRCES